jgi:homoserine dehydrogenase
LALAQKQNLNFLFEASVGGGIPIIRPMSQCLAANDVIEIDGILNGTTNFILTKMIRDQMNFDDALALAQKLGYAERNPAADVEGLDACRKICILASLAFGKHVFPDQVHTEGITNVTLADVEYAEIWGGVIKLIGRVKILENNQIHIIVCPMFVPRSSQLATVDDVFNGIQVRGDSIGDVVFYGKGAGKLPTASAVVADVIDCVRHFKARKYLFWDQAVPNYVRDYRRDTVAFYVRGKAEDPAFALGQAEGLFGSVQQLVRKGADKNEFAFVTEPLVEQDFLEQLEQLKEEGAQILATMRIGEF